MSEEIYAPQRPDWRGPRGRARSAWQGLTGLTGIEGHAFVTSNGEGGRTVWHRQGLGRRESWNGGKRGERGATEAGGKEANGRAKAEMHAERKWGNGPHFTCLLPINTSTSTILRAEQKR